MNYNQRITDKTEIFLCENLLHTTCGLKQVCHIKNTFLICNYITFLNLCVTNAVVSLWEEAVEKKAVWKEGLQRKWRRKKFRTEMKQGKVNK